MKKRHLLRDDQRDDRAESLVGRIADGSAQLDVSYKEVVVVESDDGLERRARTDRGSDRLEPGHRAHVSIGVVGSIGKIEDLGRGRAGRQRIDEPLRCSDVVGPEHAVDLLLTAGLDENLHHW